LSDHEHGVKILQELGLTFSQARIYFTLLRLGKYSTVKVISNSSDVARQDIYQLLTELQELGLIERAVDNLSMFNALPVEEVVAILAERKNQKTNALQMKATEIFRTITKIESAHIQQKNQEFVLIPKKEALIRRINRAFESAQKSIFSTTPWRELLQWRYFLDTSLEPALKRGVEIRWITDKPTNTKVFREEMRSLLEKHNFKLKIKYSNPTIRYGIYDDEKAFIAISKAPTAAESPALVTTNPVVVQMLKEHFELNWNLAKKY
jgi:sugar-specific transcriptional regulator TrmB